MRRKVKYRKPEISWSAFYGRYVVRTPYNSDYVKLIKTPFTLNITPVWCDQQKAWLIDQTDIEDVKKLVRQFFGDFDFIEKPPSFTATAVATNTKHERLIRLLGYEAMSAAWRRRMTQVHPDATNGNGRTASEINSLWQDIKRELGW